MNAEGKIAIGAVAQQLTEFFLNVYGRTVFDLEGWFLPLAIIRPGFIAKLHRTTVILLVEDLDSDQLVPQPDGGIIALAHDA